VLECPVYFRLASRVSCRVTASLANAFSRSEYARKRSAMKRCASRLGLVWTHASQLRASYSINSSARVSNFGGTPSRKLRLRSALAR